MLNFCDFIQVYVFTRNHHLKYNQKERKIKTQFQLHPSFPGRLLNFRFYGNFKIHWEEQCKVGLIFVFRFSLFVFRFSLFLFRISFFAFHFCLFAMSGTMICWHWKSSSDNRPEWKYAILTFEILFWHSHSVEIGYFDIRNPILTFVMSRNRLFWHSKSYFEIRTESKYAILTFALSRNRLFWHSKSHFDIRTESKEAILTFEILFWHWHWVEINYFDIRNPILTFALSRNMLFWHTKSYFDIRTE